MACNELESACLEAHRRGQADETPRGKDDESSWIRTALISVLRVAGSAREMRPAPLSDLVSFKPDGSPVTTREREIEDSLREQFLDRWPDAVVMGEEGGGDPTATGTTVAVDPIDGTWSLLSRTATHTISLAILKEKRPFVSVVLNPATGELAYVGRSTPTRLLQLSVFGENDQAVSLPMEKIREESVLVNVHPSRTGGELISALYRAWTTKRIRMVRSPGGSPSWALLEAAKGSFAYVNLWSAKPADPYDLVPGVQLVEGAGGKVVDHQGRAIDPQNHRGPFVAAIDDKARQAVLEILAETLPS